VAARLAIRPDVPWRQGGEGTLAGAQPARQQGEPQTLAFSDSVAQAFTAQEYHPGNVPRLHSQREITFKAASFKLSIVMPAYNEERTIARAIDEVLRSDYPCDIELIVVDDGSTDGTGVLLSQVRDTRVIVHHHPVNQGKGAALLSAISLATGTYVLPFDADLEYVPEDIPRMLEPVLKGRCSVVYGARLFGCNTVYRSFLYAAGNRLLTRMANLLFNAHLSDLHTCLKLIPLTILRGLNLSETGFGLDTEITAMLLWRGIRPFEVPVSYYGRSHAEGKKITWRDALACAWILLRVRVWSYSQRMFRNDMQGYAAPYQTLIVEADSEQAIRATTCERTGGSDQFAFNGAERQSADHVL
jgi:dolichol-phosphate hexosyltransferase